MKIDDPRLAQIHSDIARLAAVAAKAATRDDGPAFVSALKAHREAAQRLANATK